MSKSSANFNGTVGQDEQTVIGKRAPRSEEFNKVNQLLLLFNTPMLLLIQKKNHAARYNKQHEATKYTAVLDREAEELHHSRVNEDVVWIIQQALVAKE